MKLLRNIYPSGSIISDLSTNQNLQRYKYNGKELDRMHGLDWYDYGARNYDPVLGVWDRMDPLCEKYYNISPYAYCIGNPIDNLDFMGMDVYSLDKDGYMTLKKKQTMIRIKYLQIINQ